MDRLFRPADNRRDDSLANRLRRRRMRVFWGLVEHLPALSECWTSGAPWISGARWASARGAGSRSSS